jgi:hypothetical protein
MPSVFLKSIHYYFHKNICIEDTCCETTSVRFSVSLSRISEVLHKIIGFDDAGAVRDKF